MATQALFGKTAPATISARPSGVVAANPMPVSDAPTDNPYAGLDNLDEVDFGRTFATAYAPGKSMLVVFLLWIAAFGSGGHRFYLGHKWIGAAMGGLGTFNAMLWLTGGITAYLSYKAGHGLISGGLISAVAVMVIHFTWVFFDFFYILVRKFTSR